MRKRRYRVWIAVVLAVVFVGSIINVSFAGEGEEESQNNFNFNRFEKDAYKSKAANEAAERAMGTAIDTIRIVGTGTAIVMITYMGIKYMMAAPTEKAEFKKSASIYIVGAVLIFAATNILAVIIDFTSKNIK